MTKQITIDENQFEHLLNCMCNQKFIHEMSAEVQKDWQATIDKSYHEARALLSPPTSRGILRHYGFEEQVLSQWTDEECKEQLEAVEMYPEG